MITFEVGKVYLEYNGSIIDRDNIFRYVCTRRTDKTVWVAYIDDDGKQYPEERYRIHYYGDECECLYNSSISRTNWASKINLYAKNVEE